MKEFCERYKLLVLIGLVLIGPLDCMAQTKQSCRCHDDLEFVYYNILESAGYKSQVNQIGKLLEIQYQELRSNIPTDLSSTYSCYLALNQLLQVVRDRHSKIRGVPHGYDLSGPESGFSVDQFLETEAGSVFPIYMGNLDSLIQVLIGKPEQEIEGIYRASSYFTIGLVKDQIRGGYIGVVLQTSIPVWRKGEELLRLLQYSQSQPVQPAQSIQSTQLAQPAQPGQQDQLAYVMGHYTNKTLRSGFTKWKEGELIGLKLSKTLPLSNYHADYPDSTYVIRKFNENITYLKWGSFNPTNTGIAEASDFYNRVNESIADSNLILDLRNNSGGGQKNSKYLSKLLKNFKGNLYILVNFMTASHAEQFVVDLDSRPRTLILGDYTNGTIAYGINRGISVLTPSQQFSLVLTDMNFDQFIPLEGKGIAPDQFLDHNRSWIEQSMELIEQ